MVKYRELIRLSTYCIIIYTRCIQKITRIFVFWYFGIGNFLFCWVSTLLFEISMYRILVTKPVDQFLVSCPITYIV